MSEPAAAMRRLYVTYALTAVVVLAALVALPGQIVDAQLGAPRDASPIVVLFWLLGGGTPRWLDTIEGAQRPFSQLAPFVRPLAHVGPLHAGLVAIGLVFAGARVERRLGGWRTLVIFVGGLALVDLLLPYAMVAGIAGVGLDADFAEPVVLGASGGVFALFGAMLLNAIRRSEHQTMFGPLVVPMLLHGAINLFVPGEWSAVNGIGFAAGAVLSLLLPAPHEAPASAPGVQVAEGDHA